MKNGLDWMPLDVYPNSKWELIEAEYGLAGFGVIVKLLQKVYAENGYYLDWSEDAVMLFSKKVELDGNTVSKIVNSAVRRGFFDPDKYTRFHILTSAEIQKHYFNAVSRRKEIQIEPPYLLIDPAQYCKSTKIQPKQDNVCNCEKNVDILSDNADILEQSRAKESIEKESTAEEAAFSSAAPTKELLSKQYGEDLVNTYLSKAARYHYRENNALIKTAEWLAADVLSGKLTISKTRPPSFNLDEYESAVNAYTPVYSPGSKR